MYVPKAVSPQALVSTDPKQRNLQLFQSYDKKLRSLNPAEYRSVTDKFAKWANDPRAYYDEVKPIIIQLLELALNTLKSLVGLEPNALFNVHDFAENNLFVNDWKMLIGTVYRFKDKFPNKDPATRGLNARLSSLYLTVINPEETIDVDAASPQIAIVPIKQNDSASPPPKFPLMSPMRHSQQTLPTPPTTAPSCTFPPIATEQITSVIPPSTSSSPPALVPSDQISFAKQDRPRKKKRKTFLDIQAMVEIDNAKLQSSSASTHTLIQEPLAPLQQIQEMQASLATEAGLSSVEIAVTSATASKGGTRADSERARSVSTAPSIPPSSGSVQGPTLVSAKHPDMVGSDTRLPSVSPSALVSNQNPTSVTHVQHQEVDVTAGSEARLASIPSAPAVLVDSEARTSPVAPAVVTGIQEASVLGFERSHSVLATSNLLENTLQSPSSKLLDEALLGSPSLAYLTASHHMTSVSPRLSPVRTEKPEHRNVSPMEGIESGEAAQSSDVQTSLGVVATSKLEEVAMEVDSEPVERRDEIGLDMIGTEKEADIITATGQYGKGILAPSPTQPPLCSGPQIRKLTLPTSAGLGSDSNTRKQAGGHDKVFTLRFTLGASQYTSVQNWNNRSTKLILDDTKLLCLSFACYTKSDVQKASENYNVLRSRWPRGQRLCMDVTKCDGSARTISLSPPTACTPDGFVDLGPFVKEGPNAIQIAQKSDLTAYVFCLHVHRPTLSQIQNFNRMVESDREWHEWCKVVSAPLILPASKFTDLQPL